jgi:hypothetical protein
MTEQTAADLPNLLERQSKGTLVAVLLELARDHEAVQARLERLLLAEQPDRLAAEFKKTLTAWKRSRKFHDIREADALGRTLETWLEQVERELLPVDASVALGLFQDFIKADRAWFDRADDSGGAIGDAMRAACRHWLRAAARCEPPRSGWLDRLLALYNADEYGARDELLRAAHLLLDEPEQRGLVARLDAELVAMVGARARPEDPPLEVFRIAGALSLLSESLRDPDVAVRATLRYSPDPNPLQRQSFVRDYLVAGRPADALEWLQDDWGPHEESRYGLLADALERLGRFDESVPIRKARFERTLSVFDLERWFGHLADADRPAAQACAREFVLGHPDRVAAAGATPRSARAHRRQSVHRTPCVGGGPARPRLPAGRDRHLPGAAREHPGSGVFAGLRPCRPVLGEVERDRERGHRSSAPALARRVRRGDPRPSWSQVRLLDPGERHAPQWASR